VTSCATGQLADGGLEFLNGLGGHFDPRVPASYAVFVLL
jgi:hypothetical protein